MTRPHGEGGIPAVFNERVELKTGRSRDDARETGLVTGKRFSRSSGDPSPARERLLYGPSVSGCSLAPLCVGLRRVEVFRAEIEFM